MIGKFIFVSGLSGAGKSTLVGAALKSIDNLETVVTCVTRPPRAGEENVAEYVFVDDADYEQLKAAAKNWDETIYDGYKYGTDGAKYASDLQAGINIIVAVAPDLAIIHDMASRYDVQPITVWIDTDATIAQNRISSDTKRASRQETTTIKNEFNHIFTPAGSIQVDSDAFVKLVKTLLITT